MSTIFKSLVRGHPKYMILPALVALSTVTGASYGVRVAAKEPEVTWTHRPDDRPWDRYAHKQYKFWSSTSEYPDCPAPNYEL